MAISPLSGSSLPGLTGNDAATIRQNVDFASRMEQAVAKAKAAESQTAIKPLSAEEDKKMREACQGMEAIFLNLMLSRMRDTVPKSGLTGSSSQESIMRSMLDTEMTKNLAQSGGIGLADMIYRQLRQEKDAVKTSQAPK
ncbi:MAG: flagellar rod assembly protein/muramidase FlgJ [Firmicutes bacterium]|nr:flagellar rod assembly protein/muramidase FlgJ [Bacillota bacterium]